MQLTKTSSQTYLCKDLEEDQRYKVGQEYTAKLTKIRSPGHHRKFFSFLKTVYDNQDIFFNIDHLREEMTKAAGFYDCYTNHKGNTVYKAKSISFVSMDQVEFKEFYERFADSCCEVFSFDSETMEDEIAPYF